jgi:hypothetical protein
VDDSTFSFGHSDPEVLSAALTRQYSEISKYMEANRLVINDDKTHLVVMGTQSMLAKNIWSAFKQEYIPSHPQNLKNFLVVKSMKTSNGDSIFCQVTSPPSGNSTAESMD